MTRTYTKNILRTFKNTKSRFIAIFSIVALGVGFLAGLNATPEDMKESMERYMDDGNFYDIRIVSTMGLTDDDVTALEQVKGVKQVQPAYSADLLIETGDDVVVARAHSLPEDLSSDNDVPINKLVLKEGRMPEAPDECVVEAGANKMAAAYPVGTVFTVSPDITDLDKTLSVTRYTVVGIVHSSNYFSFEREPATVGNGTVKLLLYLPAEDFAYEAYTEIYLTADNALEANSLEEEYDTLIRQVKANVEDIQEERCQARYDDIRSEAQAKIDDAWDSYYSSKADADSQLADAKQELEDGRAKLLEGQKDYESGEADYQDGLKQLTENTATLTDGQQKLADARKQLQDAEARLSAAQSTLAEKEALLDQALAELQQGEAAYDKGLSEYQKNLSALEKNEKQLESLKQQLDAGEASYTQSIAALASMAGPSLNGITAEQLSDFIDDLIAKDSPAPSTSEELTDALLEAGLSPTPGTTVPPATLSSLSQLVDMRKGLNNSQASYNTNKAKLDAGRQRLQEVAAKLKVSRQQLDAGQAQYQSGLSQLENGKQQLSDASAALSQNRSLLQDQEASLTDAQKQLEDAKQQLSQARRQLDDAKAALSENEKKLEDGEKDYASAKADAEAELADGKAEIEDAQKQLDEIEMPEWYVWDRSKNVSYASFTANIDKLKAITTVFPIFFFLVAALVVSTTMTRMVEEERLQIGTLKALGYSSSMIMKKYLWYAFSASVTGTIVGLAIGFRAFPSIIWSAYEMMYYMPSIATPWRLSQALLSGGTLIALSMLVTYFTCRSSLGEVPAALMLPRAPKAGKRILLERITPVWRHFPFSWKVTCRNLFRYKKRFWMTIIGVMGCTSLLVAGFGISDSLNAIITKQYSDVFHYDLMTIVTKEQALESGEVYEYLFDNPGIFSDSLAVSMESTRQSSPSGDVDVYLMVPESLSGFSSFVDLHERVSKKATPLSDDGVVITEKLAKAMNVKAGDSITLKNGNDATATFLVTGVCEHYVSNYAYMSSATYTSGFGTSPELNAALSIMPDDSQEIRDQASADLLDMNSIASLNFTQDSMSQVLNMLNSINAVVVLIIICAACLAFVVLYNLSNINVAERVKEIATIKVLGFYRHEVNSYVNRESIALTIIGIFFGLFGGIALHRFVISTVEVDAVMFGRNIRPVSFLYAIALTLLFSTIVNVVMSGILKKISMVESMKAPE